MIGDFHFIRPAWLAALLPLTVLVWLMFRAGNAKQAWRGVIAPHLLPFLLSGEDEKSRRMPVVLVAIGWAVATIAVAGPTWRREPATFADETSAMAIVVKVSPSMMTEDVQPSRLARSVQKIHDLLSQRRGAKTALVAYAGSAHLVMPATSDGEIIDTFAQALDPKIMPTDGDAAAEAMRLADQSLNGEGSILWITDGVAAEENAPLATWRKGSRTAVQLLAPLTAGAEMESLRKGAASVDASVEPIRADDGDVAKIARVAKFSTSGDAGKSDRWEESGYWLTPLLALLMLPFFRRGWMAPTASRT